MRGGWKTHAGKSTMRVCLLPVYALLFANAIERCWRNEFFKESSLLRGGGVVGLMFAQQPAGHISYASICELHVSYIKLN